MRSSGPRAPKSARCWRRPSGDTTTSSDTGRRCMPNDVRSRIVTTNAEIDAAIARGRLASLPSVVAAEYDRVRDEIALRFDNGTRLQIPRALLEGLADA